MRYYTTATAIARRCGMTHSCATMKHTRLGRILARTEPDAIRCEWGDTADGPSWIEGSQRALYTIETAERIVAEVQRLGTVKRAHT